jgi:dihydroxyacetone kinase-like predicted kinase
MADPGPALSAGIGAGSLRNVKIDNMQLQHEEWAAGHEGASAAQPVPLVGLVAAAAGPGLAATFRELGAVPLLTSDGEKPSAGAFLEAARRAGERHVFLLPNDKDAVMAAEQAAREAPDFISVIPARSIPAGMSAAVAYQPDDDLEEIAETMGAAIDHVRCIEVTVAGRDAAVGGVTVAAGKPIALLDGVLVTSGATLEDALLAALAKTVDEASELVTVYLGADAEAGAGERVLGLIREAHPGLAVEIVAGGQPYYPYVVGVE